MFLRALNGFLISLGRYMDDPKLPGYWHHVFRNKSMSCEERLYATVDPIKDSLPAGTRKIVSGEKVTIELTSEKTRPHFW